MIQLDSSLLLQIINFVLLIFILNSLLYKPMLAIIDKRKKHLLDSEEEVSRLNRTVEEKMAAYEDKVRSVRSESLAKNKELIKEGSDRAKAILDETSGEISMMAEEFHGKMQREIQNGGEFLTNRSRALSMEIAEKALGRRIQ
ncbi:MAG: ATP synthase F0 subunit B [Syntrophales bacterium]|nr:ATP synthase F0 subunit B [Syntrophales bacterium]